MTSTPTRGPASNAVLNGQRRPPTRPPGSPPVRRPGQWVGMVALLLLTGVAATWLWQQKADRVEVLVTRTSVPAGQVVTAEDLTTAEVAGVGGALTADDLAELIGRVAAVGLVPGQVLTADMVTDSPVPGPGQRVVGLMLDPARVPPGLSAGDVVTVLRVPIDGDAGSSEQLEQPAVLAASVSVRSVGRVQGGSTRLGLVVTATDANQVAAFAAAGQVAVVQGPIGGDD